MTVRVDEELRKAERRKAQRAAGEEKRKGRAGSPRPLVGGGAAVSSQGMGGDSRSFGRPSGRSGGGAGGRGGAGAGAGGKDAGGKRYFFRRRKVCKFCADKIDYVDYKDVKLLGPFVPERGKILPRRMFGTCAEHQRKLTLAIKRARNIALLPFAAD